MLAQCRSGVRRTAGMRCSQTSQQTILSNCIHRRAPTLDHARVVKPGGLIRLLEYVRPQGTIRRVVAKIWEPWIGWAYGASFDRRTEERIPAAGLQIQESRFVVPDLMKFISVRVGGK